MTPLAKHLCKIRNRQIKKGINPELQERINKVKTRLVTSEKKVESPSEGQKNGGEQIIK